MRRTSMGCLIALMIPAFSAAQSSTDTGWPPNPGTRVRLDAPTIGVHQQIGTFLSATRDSLFIQQVPGTSPRSIGATRVTRLEVASGTHTSKLSDSMIGLGAGVAAGALIGSATLQPKPGDFFYNSHAEARKFGAALGGLIGGLLGGVTGLSIGAQQSDTWIAVKIPRS